MFELRIMDEFSKNKDNFIFLRVFNTWNDNAITFFCSLNGLTSLLDQPTCYKNPNKLTCFDFQYLQIALNTSNKMSSKQASLTFIWLL